MKKFVSLVSVFLLVLSLSAPAFADSACPASSGMSKQEFAEYCHNLHLNRARSAATELTEDEADQLVIEYALCSDYQERAQIEAQLNDAGVFIYDDGSGDQIAPLSTPADVTLNNVICSYNDNTGSWSLVAGGHWNDIRAPWEDLTYPALSPNLPANVGGLDAVGITLYNTSGKLPALQASFGQINDHNGNTITLNNPSVADTNKGTCFEYQDYITPLTNNGSFIPEQNAYMGYGFAAVMRFNSSFVNWHGTARTFYVHTWKETTISSLSLSVSSTSYGISVTFSAANNKFVVYSNGDTRF